MTRSLKYCSGRLWVKRCILLHVFMCILMLEVVNWSNILRTRSTDFCSSRETSETANDDAANDDYDDNNNTTQQQQRQ
ncbi:hypothetical protein M0802_011559 [Mischocyttarus mexicanus]|nr:hypothetical protein M0802_011559 [Mischocyttarus mexicanus]